LKKKLFYAFLIFSLIALAGVPVLHAEENVGEVFEQDEDDSSDPSDVAEELDSTPGERAPEYLPMDDAPGVAGLGIN